jgi:hypothetical protein
VSQAEPFLLALCMVGLVGGLVALWRGLAGHRAGALVEGLSTSRISTLAAGEVRITGVVETAEVLLRSPLQDRECVWYRSRVETSGRNDTTTFKEERGIGFRVCDPSGSIRVFPRGARLDVPDRYNQATSLMGDPPPGLSPRRTSVVMAEPAVDREAAIAALLTVQPAAPTDAIPGLDGGFGSDDGRRFIEARLEPGDVVTVVGTARPFSTLEDPATADALEGSLDPLGALADAEVAADVAEALAAGTLTSPEEAWGNAAIPGFGIGRPVRAPELDPAARLPALATPTQAAEIERTFDIGPDLLVIASAPDAPLLVAWGAPGEVVARNQAAFSLGLVGAVLAIISVLGGAMLLSGR